MIHVVADPNVWGATHAVAVCGDAAPFTEEGDMPAGFDFVEVGHAELADCRACRQAVGLHEHGTETHAVAAPGA